MSHERDEILAKIGVVVRDVFHLPGEFAVGAQTTSADVGGWDSLSHSILIMKIEEAFGLDLPLDRIFDLRDVGELADLIARVRGGSPA